MKRPKKHFNYVVTRTRHFYNAPPVRSVEHCDELNVLRFATPAAARAWIEENDVGTWHLSHNEYGRPAYRVRRLDTLPESYTWGLSTVAPVAVTSC
jgi:hypothetical protein